MTHHAFSSLPRNRAFVLVGLGVVGTVAIVVSLFFPTSARQQFSQPLTTTEIRSSEVPTPNTVHADIPVSQALEVLIPAVGIDAPVEQNPCRVKDEKINPATLDKACTYTADDKPYSLPGTDAKDIVVIAGHTGAGVDAVFNNLYDGTKNTHTIHLGDKLYVRTSTSGTKWLMYTATDLHDPQKGVLAEDESIWGTGPMPGRLLTISCVQSANLLAASVRNSVIGWQLDEPVEIAPRR